MAEARQATRHTLTKPQMGTIKAFIKDVGWAEGVVEVYKILIAPRKWEEVTELDGRDYSIPDSQWQEICGWLIEANGITAGLAWMNQGPSGFQELPELPEDSM